MTILKYKLTLFIILMFFCNMLMAQNEKAQISGFVFNPDNEPAMYSTVVLLNKDSVLVKGVLSQEDGSYLLENVEPEDYYLQIRNIEFRTYISDLITIEPGMMLELDPIYLLQAVNQLGEVVVSADKNLIEIHPDKMVYNVSASVNASGTNALELLGDAPGVTVDMDNSISLQGKSGVQIYINGRPSRLSGDDLANLLEGMSSDNIESIELITNPSAKYDAEGTGGIINIIMKKNKNLGFNGNLVSGYSLGNHGRGNVGTSLNYMGEKLAFNTSLSINDSEFQDDFNEISEQRGFILDMQTDGLYYRTGYNFSGGMDYTLNEKNSISLDGRVFITDRGGESLNNTGIAHAQDELPAELLIAETFEDDPTENYMINLNHRHTPGTTANISTNISFGRYDLTGGTDQPNTYYDPGIGSVIRTSNSRFDTGTSIDIASAMVDYEKKFSFLTFSTGAKYSYIRTDNSLAFYNFVEGSPVYDISQSNDFSYEENVAAFYFMMNAQPNEYLSLNAGVRMENTSSLGVLDSEVPTLDDRVNRNYNDFFPSIGISYNNQKNSTISASVGRRINRPDYQSLNPFEYKMSEIQSWKGNPFLQPNYITNYNLSYSWKRKLVISNSYSITRDFFATIFVAEEENSFLTPRNMDKVTNYALSVTYPVQPLEWWQFNTFLNYNYETYEGNLQGTLIDLTVSKYNFRIQNMLKLPGEISLELTYYNYSPWIWRGSVEVEGNQGLNVGVRKSFMNRTLIVQLTGKDIFRTNSDYFYQSNYGGIVTDGVRTFDNQRFGFSLTWNFGNQQAKARQRSRSAIDEEMRRISDD